MGFFITIVSDYIIIVQQIKLQFLKSIALQNKEDLGGKGRMTSYHRAALRLHCSQTDEDEPNQFFDELCFTE